MQKRKHMLMRTKITHTRERTRTHTYYISEHFWRILDFRTICQHSILSFKIRLPKII